MPCWAEEGGGGSFLSVPVLIYLGMPSVSANMSSTVALYPGSLASAWAYRGHVQAILDVPLTALFLATFAGGLSGALVPVSTPNAAFDKLMPWLLLLGSLAFACGPAIGDRLRSHSQPRALGLLLAQFLLGGTGATWAERSGS
jgi:uncharacterized membrane protein YfcA